MRAAGERSRHRTDHGNPILTLDLHVMVPRLQSFPSYRDGECRNLRLGEPIAFVPSAGVATFGRPSFWSCNFIVRLIAL
jgi:hypothetical protein